MVHVEKGGGRSVAELNDYTGDH